tara:strand:+ start:431 stop:1000 length:570 start_codon:yes stop_codon:yes gene_type:complete
MVDTMYEVKQIERKQALDRILDVHYLHRVPSISFTYGLFLDGELTGVITYGSPASPHLCRGICGETFKRNVIELNRLVLDNNQKNEASFLIANSLKLLPKPKIVVSYADTAQNHKGVVYQATNWLYTGCSKPRTDIRAEGGKHPRHHAGNKLDRVFRSGKHRYVMFTGNKREKKVFKQSLNYKIQEYPK